MVLTGTGAILHRPRPCGRNSDPAHIMRTLTFRYQPSERGEPWAKLIRSSQDLFVPNLVRGPEHVPGVFVTPGETVELWEGDFFVESALFARRTRAQHVYTVSFLSVHRRLVVWFDNTPVSTWIREAVRTGRISEEQGKSLLLGRKRLASVMRIMHWCRITRRNDPEAIGNRVAFQLPER